jgi:hypothetical protein
MRKREPIEFERKRGIIWVCDVQDSSKALNSDNVVDAIEEFLPRLLWIGRQVVEAARGSFVKWTGDGFLSWFPCELERERARIVANAFDAAWHLSFTNNVTNLAVRSSGSPSFSLRHGITWEPDALVMSVEESNDHRSMDILGRDVVLAFRLASIRVDFPHISTQKALADIAIKHAHTNHTFNSLNLSDDDVLKYFKGERRSLKQLVGSSEARKSRRSKRPVVDQVMGAFKMLRSGLQNQADYAKMVDEYVNRLRSGPEWAKEILDKETRFINNDLIGTLLKVLESSGNIQKSIEQTDAEGFQRLWHTLAQSGSSGEFRSS